MTKISDDIVLNGTVADNVNPLIDNLTFDLYYNSLSMTEQKAILIYIAVFEDSYNYWSENADQWGFSDEPMTRGFWSSVVKYAKADATGAFIGGVGNAVAGAWTGGVAGAVTGSLTLAICDGVGHVSNDLVKSVGIVDSTAISLMNKK